MALSARIYQKISPHFLKYLFFLGCMILIFLVAPHAFAGTDGAELKPAADKISGLIGGWGGKLVCMVSLLMALIGSTLKFNPYVIVGCLGVCITAALGVTVVNTSVTALI